MSMRLTCTEMMIVQETLSDHPVSPPSPEWSMQHQQLEADAGELQAILRVVESLGKAC